MAKSPEKRSTKTGTGKDADFLSLMRKRVEMASDDQRSNSEEGYEDLDFATGIGQWDSDIRREREAEGRPCLTYNLVLQFCRQVTGDMRQSRPAIKVFGVDDKADPETAKDFNEVIRHIENRSDAKHEYFKAADNQVMAGIGYLRLETEEPAKGKPQEIRVSSVRDSLGVLDDTDARLPGKLDRKWAFIPIDLEYEVFKQRYPDAKLSGFTDLSMARAKGGMGSDHEFWTTANKIRIGEYFTRDDEEVMRYVVSDSEILEPGKPFPSKFIPLVPVPGEEIYVGPRVYRFGKIRHLKPAQRALNYWLSAETEIIALQPKSPYVGTTTNFKNHPEWADANRRNLSRLEFTPDPLNGGQAPQRSQPPMASQGISVAVDRAVDMLRQISGIYDASLGARSNESSGVAIRARDQQGDTGTFVYPSNFAASLQQLGRILVDMIPRVYDTTRVLRILGEDGAVNETTINKPMSINPETGETEYGHDLSVGEYDVVVETGPSYATKREEAREGMAALIQAYPQVFALIGDMYVKGQDWPMADKMAERIRELLPPQIKKKEEAEAGEDGQPGQPVQPDPQEVMAMQAQEAAVQAELAIKDAEVKTKQAQARKAEADAAKAEIEVKAALVAPMQPQAAPEAPQDDPRMLELQNAVLDIQEALDQISGSVEQLAGAVVEIAGPMPEPPPDEMAGMPMDQEPPPEGGFLMPEQPGQPPQF